MSASESGDEIRVARLIEACEELAGKLDIRVLREKMSSASGLCRLKNEWRLYLTDELEPDEELEVYARALARFDLSDQYVLPALREEIERYSQGS